jgi:hypothetical protein
MALKARAWEAGELLFNENLSLDTASWRPGGLCTPKCDVYCCGSTCILGRKYQTYQWLFGREAGWNYMLIG